MGDIKQIIDQLVVDKTFSLEAIEAIKALRDERDELDVALAKANKSAESERKLRDAAEEGAGKLSLRVDELEKQAAANAALIANAEKQAANADKQQAVAAAYRDAMAMVFKPSIVRESVMRNIQAPQVNGMYVPPTTENETRTIETE